MKSDLKRNKKLMSIRFARYNLTAFAIPSKCSNEIVGVIPSKIEDL